MNRGEVLDGPERRRRWSDEEKSKILDDLAQPGTRAGDVARRYGVSRSLLYAWRKELAPLTGTVAAPTPEMAFAPVLPPQPHRVTACAQAPRASQVQTASTALRDARSAVQPPGAICKSDLGSRRTVAQPLPRLPPASPVPQVPPLFRHRSNDGAAPVPSELQPVSCIRLSGASKSVA